MGYINIPLSILTIFMAAKEALMLAKIKQLNNMAAEAATTLDVLSKALATLTAEAQMNIEEPVFEQKVVSLRELCKKLGKDYSKVRAIVFSKDSPVKENVHYQRTPSGWFKFDYHLTRAALAERLKLDQKLDQKQQEQQ